MKSGDVLREITARFGTTVADIQAANRIPNVDLIRVGQVLEIPGTEAPQAPPAGDSGVTYVVRKGDTLGKIAQAQGVSVQELLNQNPQIDDPDLIRSGQLIQVPNGVEAASGVIPKVVAPDTDGDPLWLAYARKELESDVEEEAGAAAHNPRILEYHATTPLKANADETPWCSSFVNWCVTQAGLTGTNRANARSWLNWGDALTEPKTGAVAVFWRGDNNDRVTGHVGFFLRDDGETVRLLGGNQGDRCFDQESGHEPISRFPLPNRRLAPNHYASRRRTFLSSAKDHLDASDCIQPRAAWVSIPKQFPRSGCNRRDHPPGEKP